MFNLASQFIHDHNNPVKHVEAPPAKYFLSKGETEINVQKKTVDLLIEKQLRHNRVDRRCARAVVNWSPPEQLGKVIKDLKLTQGHYGKQNKEGKFLTPVEMLHLLESNKLEIFNGNIPITIQECYQHIIKNSQESYKKYVIFKKLILNGFKLKIPLIGTHLKSGIKRKAIKEDPSQNKLCRVENQNVFETLKKNGPKISVIEDCPKEPDYLLTKAIGNVNSNHNVIISSGDSFRSSELQASPSNIYVLGSNDNCAFYKFYINNVPCNE